MFNEKDCLENLKRIVSEYADDENIKNLSLDELRSSYTKIADNLFPISVSNRLKYKNMLWNIDNLKPEIRLKFQARLFNTWHSAYIKSAKTDPTEDRPEIQKQGSTSVLEAKESPDVDAKGPTSVITEQQPIKSEKEKRAASSEAANLGREMKPEKEQSPITVPKASVHQFENDWFDKFLDFIATMVGGVAGMVGY